MPLPEERESKSDAYGTLDPKSSFFSQGANERCIFCYKVTERKTAEVLYASGEWDFYYCYRCRSWFKRYYKNEKLVLPVRDRRDISHLTWTYVSQMQSLERKAQFERSMKSVWRALGRRFSL